MGVIHRDECGIADMVHEIRAKTCTKGECAPGGGCVTMYYAIAGW